MGSSSEREWRLHGASRSASLRYSAVWSSPETCLFRSKSTSQIERDRRTTAIVTGGRWRRCSSERVHGYLFSLEEAPTLARSMTARGRKKSKSVACQAASNEVVEVANEQRLLVDTVDLLLFWPAGIANTSDSVDAAACAAGHADMLQSVKQTTAACPSFCSLCPRARAGSCRRA